MVPLVRDVWYSQAVLLIRIHMDPHHFGKLNPQDESASERLVGSGSIPQKPDPYQHQRQNSASVEKCPNESEIREKVSIFLLTKMKQFFFLKISETKYLFEFA